MSRSTETQCRSSFATKAEKLRKYSYTTSPVGTRYRIGGLKEGIYRYTASTQLSTGKEQVSGEFLVTAQNIESQNLTADFGLLRKLSDESGGKFSTDVNTIASDFSNLKSKTLIHSEDSFHPMINLKAVFFLLLFIAEPGVVYQEVLRGLLNCLR
ncbi:MAG: hypothetical protein WDO15_09790 [Bacteroidota bacterium]